MKRQLGPDWERFRDAHEETPPVSIRVNPLKAFTVSSHDHVPWAANGYYLKERPSFTLDPAFHAGAYYVQEASSMFLEQAFRHAGGGAEGLTVLDLCAAPGGKSTHLLSLMTPDSILVSNEVIRARANILSENIQKWGHANAIVTSSDPQQFKALEGVFDIAVVDAPCSGEGMFRKDPAAISAWSPENIVLCSRRQQRILDEVWPAIRQGGYLIYSTCTYNEQENEDQFSRLLGLAGAESLAIPLDPQWNVVQINKDGVQGYRFYPHNVSGEGLFVAVLRKTDGRDAPRFKVSGDLSRIATSLSASLKGWLSEPVSFFAFKDDIRFIPPGREKLLQLLSKHLYLVGAGTLVGTAKHNKVVPAHALALSVNIDPASFAALPVDKETALRYLRREPIEAGDVPRGFALVTYNGLRLGWVNVLDTRTNNLYPTDWRIRKEINELQNE